MFFRRLNTTWNGSQCKAVTYLFLSANSATVLHLAIFRILLLHIMGSDLHVVSMCSFSRLVHVFMLITYEYIVHMYQSITPRVLYFYASLDPVDRSLTSSPGVSLQEVALLVSIIVDTCTIPSLFVSPFFPLAIALQCWVLEPASLYSPQGCPHVVTSTRMLIS